MRIIELTKESSSTSIASVIATLAIFGLKRSLRFLFGLGLFLAFLVRGSQMTVFSQDAATAAASSDAAAVKVLVDDTRYRIGPGDVLNIVVRKAPELSGPVRVDQRGMIRLPMIDGEVTAACRTESELATQITTLYLEYKNNPSVEVFVTEFQSRPVAVIGAVNAPGQFRLQRQVRRPPRNRTLRPPTRQNHQGLPGPPRPGIAAISRR